MDGNLLIFNDFIFIFKNISPVIYLVFVWLLTS
ncbi:membrane protein [Escherichia coli]|nr:membrane protein [Escherichia coli]